MAATETARFEPIKASGWFSWLFCTLALCGKLRAEKARSEPFRAKRDKILLATLYIFH